MNVESDSTAIWLECKFDVPDSGEWLPDNIFSVPLLPESRHKSKGSPGLIVFERTPLNDLHDVLEKSVPYLFAFFYGSDRHA